MTKIDADKCSSRCARSLPVYQQRFYGVGSDGIDSIPSSCLSTSVMFVHCWSYYLHLKTTEICLHTCSTTTSTMHHTPQ